MDTRGYVELIKASLNESYYKITRLLGVTDSTMARWRTGKGGASEETALKIAELSKIDPALVLTDIDIEHAKSEEVKAVRLRIREILQRSAAIVVVVFISTGAVLNHVQCVLCQIVERLGFGQPRRRCSTPRADQTHNQDKLSKAPGFHKGLNHAAQKTTSRLGRLLRGRRIYLPTRRACRTPESDRELLVSDFTAPASRRRTRTLQSARAAISIGLIAVSGSCCASWGLSLGTISDHSDQLDHNERNPGLCLETGFKRFGVACAYRDSNKETATAFAVGGRFQLFPGVHLGGAFGVKIAKALNEEGLVVNDPDPLAAGIVTVGTEKISANVVITPAVEDTPGARWLQIRMGF